MVFINPRRHILSFLPFEKLTRGTLIHKLENMSDYTSGKKNMLLHKKQTKM